MRAWYRLGLPALAVVACAACSFLLDRNATQCTTDADCAALGFHFYCAAPVCVDAGVGPNPACFYGTPSQPADFLNQCSTGFLPDPGSACTHFDDCMRLGDCDDASAQPLPPDGGTVASATAHGSTTGSCSAADLGAGMVVVTGSSNFPNVMTEIAQVIHGTQGNLDPLPNPVFVETNSCTAVKTMFAGPRTVFDPPSGAPQNKYAFYYDQNNTKIPCSLGDAGMTLDVAESDVYSSTCDVSMVAGPNAGVTESQGPVQAMAFVVPYDSSQTTISHEAAREVFGSAGNMGAAAPWTQPSLYFVRNKGTGTQQMIAKELFLDPGMFWGVDQGSASNVAGSIASVQTGHTAAQLNAAIGIISVDLYDADRRASNHNMRALAFQETGQYCAYLPDSTSESLDKQNVRDGHYPIWGPLHFYTPYPPTNDNATAFVTIMTASLGKAVLDAFINASVIPPCAMGVQRDQGVELGPLSPVMAGANSCACYFESNTRPKDQAASRFCNGCNTNADCGGGRKCSVLKFCEVPSGI